MVMYTTEYKGWLPASGRTTGGHFWKPGTLTNSNANRSFTPPYGNIPPGPISAALITSGRWRTR